MFVGFFMKARWSVAALAVPFLLVVAPCAAQPSPERMASARELANVYAPSSEDAVQADFAAAAIEGFASRTIAFSGGWPALDERQLRVSIGAGAQASVVASRASLVQALTDRITDEELQDALEFYRSRPGRATLRARAAHAARLHRWMREPSSPAPEYTPNAAERAFEASRAGQALAAAIASGSDTLQQAVVLAEADYCDHVACGADQHEFFRRLVAIINPRRARGEHATWGQTASDLFQDPAIASLARAACGGDAEAVAAAVQAGANPNAVGGEGVGPGVVSEVVSPLLWAIDCGNADGVEALLEAGADPNQREHFGATPITVAADNRDPRILQVLLAHGGDPNAHDGQRTALEIAMVNENGLALVDRLPAEQVQANWNALLAAGADPDRHAPDGQPLIEVAGFNNHWIKVEWLLHRGWDGDWVLLGRTLESMEENGGVPELERGALQRVRQIIIAHGVRFPIGALIDLERDSRGYYVQPPTDGR